MLRLLRLSSAVLVRLTNYGSDPGRLNRNDFQNFITEVEKGNIKLPIDRVFRFEDIVEATNEWKITRQEGKSLWSMIKSN